MFYLLLTKRGGRLALPSSMQVLRLFGGDIALLNELKIEQSSFDTGVINVEDNTF